MNNQKLYIIGNGFDLYHQLPTSYEHFRVFLIDNYPEILEFIEQYFVLDDTIDEYKWNNFEYNLSSFDYGLFFDDNDYADIKRENFKQSDYFGVEDELTEISEQFIEDLKEAFYEWLSEIKLECKQRYPISTKAKFLSFNYTLLLQNNYEIPRTSIFYIHGNLEQKTELFFGHGTDLEIEPTFDENGEPTRTFMTDAVDASKSIYGSFRKPVQQIIENNKVYFESLANTKEIIILGHSLNEIDLPYFIEIHKFANNANWKISTFSPCEQKKFNQILKKIGIDESKIEFFEINS